MRLIYEPSNSIEAHMVLNLLEQAGLSGRIDGEFLQGGVGDLQAIGLIRVMIEEADYEAATSIIEQWDKHQPGEVVKQVPQRIHPLFSGFIGLCVGLISLTVYYNTPVSHDGIDYDGDGLLDEKWEYIHGRISKTEADRNFDGKVDYIIHFDNKGIVISGSSDDDFDGVFETDLMFSDGNDLWSKSDTTGDGYKNYQVFYSNGILSRVKFINPVSDRPVKIQRYEGLKLSSAELDTNGDGRLDTSYQYDEFEEVNKVELINKNK